LARKIKADAIGRWDYAGGPMPATLFSWSACRRTGNTAINP
jgi:hypothetical protein